MDEDGITVEGLRKSGADIAHISPGASFSKWGLPCLRTEDIVLAWANEKMGVISLRMIMTVNFVQMESRCRHFSVWIPVKKVIYMNTFSKSLTPTIRISYMILPVHLANQFYQAAFILFLYGVKF